MTTPIDTIPGIVQRLYELVRELENAFPGRPFTPDGHLVGSLGEVLASHYYDLDLLPCSTECHDAQARDGRLVQVKATQGSTVALRAQPDHLLVILLKRDGTIEEAYNGPGRLAWTNCGKRQKNGQSPISVSKLRKLMRDVPANERLPRAIEQRNAEANESCLHTVPCGHDVMIDEPDRLAESHHKDRGLIHLPATPP